MPAIHSITVPKWGLSMEKGRLTAWHRQVGDRVSPGEEICDIETDKISGGLEVNVGGVLRRKLAQENIQNRILTDGHQWLRERCRVWHQAGALATGKENGSHDNRPSYQGRGHRA